MNSLFLLLSSKKTAWLFTIIAVACRVVNVFFVSEIGRDKIYLALQSRSFLEGNGFGIPKYYTSALTTPIFDLTPMWPPGYPILLAPFLKIFNYDVYWAATSLDIIACIAFIFIVRKIALDLNFPMIAVNIITLIAGSFDYAFIYESLPTDAPSFAIFLLGLWLLLRVVRNEKFQADKLVLASFLLFLPCTFRYSYPPLSIAALLAVIFIGLYLKNRITIKKGLVGLTTVLLLFATFYLIIKLSTGKGSYIVETERGFFPEQLLEWAPVGPGAFINTFFTTSQLNRITGISFEKAMTLLEIINAIMFAGFIILFFYLFFKKRFFRSTDPFKHFFIIGLFISAATCASLGYLTLTNRPQSGWGNYLGEPRYFMFVTLFIQLCFFGWVFLFPAWKKCFFQRSIVFILSFLLFVEVAHSIYFHSKVALSFDTYRSATYKDEDYVYFLKMMPEFIRNNPDSDIYTISDNDEFFTLASSFLGQKGLYDGKMLLEKMPIVKKKTLFVLALYDNELASYQPLFTTYKAKLINRVNNVNFYSFDILP